MDIYKPKFTLLQQAMLNFLFAKPEISFNERALAKGLKVSPTAVSKSLGTLEKEKLIKVSKDKESKRLSIGLDRENPRVFHLKRANNLKQIYESGLAEYLSDSFPGATIVLFGSYSFGEDTSTSDIDIAVIGSRRKDTSLSKFEGLLERKIVINFYGSLKAMDKNLRENICNGIVLKGSIEL